MYYNVDPPQPNPQIGYKLNWRLLGYVFLTTWRKRNFRWKYIWKLSERLAGLIFVADTDERDYADASFLHVSKQWPTWWQFNI